MEKEQSKALIAFRFRGRCFCLQVVENSLSISPLRRPFCVTATKNRKSKSPAPFVHNKTEDKEYNNMTNLYLEEVFTIRERSGS